MVTAPLRDNFLSVRGYPRMERDMVLRIHLCMGDGKLVSLVTHDGVRDNGNAATIAYMAMAGPHG